MLTRHRTARLAASMFLGATLATPLAGAWAQTSGSSDSTPDLVPVTVWTAIAVGIALLLTSVGYLYRRKLGMNHPLPEPPIPLAAAVESHDVSRDAAGNPLPAHALEHAAGMHDDATEQAALLSGREAGVH